MNLGKGKGGRCTILSTFESEIFQNRSMRKQFFKNFKNGKKLEERKPKGEDRWKLVLPAVGLHRGSCGRRHGWPGTAGQTRGPQCDRWRQVCSSLFGSKGQASISGRFLQVNNRRTRRCLYWNSPTLPLSFLNQVTPKNKTRPNPPQPPPGDALRLRSLEGAATLTLQRRSSSTSTSSLNAGTTSLPSVQYIPRLLSDTTQVLLCPGSCCLRLAIEVTLTGVLYGGIFCSHSETQEATEMLLQELERLWSCGWLRSCWPLAI